MSSDEAPFGEYDSGNESPQDDDDTEEDFGQYPINNSFSV